MIAHVEVSRSPRGWGRRRIATDDKVDAEHTIGVAYDTLREGEVEVDTNEGQHETKWQPNVGEERVKRGWGLD